MIQYFDTNNKEYTKSILFRKGANWIDHYFETNKTNKNSK